MDFDINKIWRDLKYPEKLQKHCQVVNKKALELGDNLISDGIKVNRELVDVGSLLHDIGREKVHTIDHALKSYEKAKELGFSEDVALIVRNHLGSGIKKDEAVKLGLPAEDFMPRTIEQKIVSYADNLIDNNKEMEYEIVLKKWEKRWGADANLVHRLKMQHEELENYIDSAGMTALEQSSKTGIETLMENAGKGVAEFVLKNFELEEKKIVVFCGAGNNGGDGFVAARYLKQAGIDVELAIFGEQKTELSKENFKRAEEHGIRFNMLIDPEHIGGFGADVIIDSIFGTGISGEIKEPIASTIEWINRKEIPVISVDVPSGVNPDNGETSAVFVKANYTLCMHRVKKGLVGNENAGELEIVEIRI